MGCLSQRGAKGRIVGLRVKQGVEVGLSDSMLKMVFEILMIADRVQFLHIREMAISPIGKGE
jgi:hypothetical protein